MGLLRIEVAGLSCAPPNLITAKNEPLNSYEDFELSWDYGGIDYSGDTTTSITIQYSLDGGTSWNNYAGGIVMYPETTASINIPSIIWENIHFRIYVSNRSCYEYSNVIITEYVAA